MIIAEELSCDWRRVEVVQADLDQKYGDQLTGGSLSVRTSYNNLRKAGAAAREMLLTAAATRWNVPRAECVAESGSLIHLPTQRKLFFEQVLSDALALLPPADPPLKNPREFKLIGKSTPRTDSRVKVTGGRSSALIRAFPGCLWQAWNVVPSTVARLGASMPVK